MDKLNFRSRDFVHLHLHTDYSLLQSTIQLKPLAKKLNDLQMRACAITDYGNMFGAISFYSAMRDAGLRPIVGYEAHVALGSRLDRSLSVPAGERPYYNLVLLATGSEGYQNLVHLSSKAYTEGLHHKPRIDFELLADHSAGLVALSGGLQGQIGHYLLQRDREKAKNAALRISEVFGKENFYLEIQDHGLDEERTVMEGVAELSNQLGIPVVATNDAHYLNEDDARAREVAVCIGEGRTLNAASAESLNSKYYVRTAEEMWALFGDDFPEALVNTVEIADRCELELAIDKNNLTLPIFPIPKDSGCATLDGYLRKVVLDGFEWRKMSILVPMREKATLRKSFDAYEKRIDVELSVIAGMGYAGYFLIVWDFIKYAIERGIPVGPGRGSAAGSLVAYCLGITGIDPLQYDLFFERFLNPERVSMPDIDIDFCIRGRGEVINHVAELYGRESVCQIITFGTMASRAAIKDVGRALSVPYGDVEKIAKLIPPPYRGRNISISEAIEKVAELKSEMVTNPRVKEVIDLALKIEGCSRHTSVHAAGVVISPKPLHEIVPVAMSPKKEYTSQYPMGDLEKVGLLKMDFLGLTTLTIISDCLKSLKEKSGLEIDWTAVSLTDEKTMKLFSDGRTDAIFQFESSGMQEICRRLKPKELEDLSALNALYRPGPLDGGMIEDFILRHKGEKEVEYLVPEMEEILKNTYGVLVYQEQIMQLAQRLSGYSLGEADLMRRAMGKKKPKEMAVHEERFISGAKERGIDKRTAKEIFDLMAKFADYGFNRSHSIAYAYLAFQTGYLKAHYPAFFYAAVLSHEADDSAKVYKYSNELRSMGLNLLPPDVNQSDEDFTPSKDSVRFGLNAIKGLGSASAHAIIEARRSGPFASLYDFVSRVDQGAINRRGLESLVTAGAFDSIMPADSTTNLWRARLFAGIDNALSYGLNVWNDRERGQTGLFGGGSDAQAVPHLPDVAPWSQMELSNQEKAAVGFYLSAHPLDGYTSILQSLHIRNIADHGEIAGGSSIVLAGIVSAAQVRWSKRGNRFCTFRLEDQSMTVKCLAWSDAYDKFGEFLKDDEIVIVEGRVESAEGQDITLIVSDARSLHEQISRNARAVSITLPKRVPDENYLSDLFSTLNEFTGRCDVILNMTIDCVEVSIQSGPIRIQGSHRIETALKERGCSVSWIL
jgi:DNA polymerase-3 subunit alpha